MDSASGTEADQLAAFVDSLNSVGPECADDVGDRAPAKKRPRTESAAEDAKGVEDADSGGDDTKDGCGGGEGGVDVVPTAVPDHQGLVARANTLDMALARLHPHAEDAHWQFVDRDPVTGEDAHYYTYDGKRMTTSVSGLLELITPDEEHFDPDATVRRMMASRDWPSAKYSDTDPETGMRVGWTAERIKAAWTTANQLGTHLHGLIERLLNGLVTVDDVPDSDPVRKNLVAFVTWYDAQRAAGWSIYRTEWVIGDPDADVAGSVDGVMFHEGMGVYRLVDWKRCETYASKGFATPFGNKRFLAPCADLGLCKLAKWRLQICLYAAILERRYGMRMEGGMMMLAFNDQSDTAEEHVHQPYAGAARILRERCLARGVDAYRTA